MLLRACKSFNSHANIPNFIYRIFDDSRLNLKKNLEKNLKQILFLVHLQEIKLTKIKLLHSYFLPSLSSKNPWSYFPEQFWMGNSGIKAYNHAHLFPRQHIQFVCLFRRICWSLMSLLFYQITKNSAENSNLASVLKIETIALNVFRN